MAWYGWDHTNPYDEQRDPDYELCPDPDCGEKWSPDAIERHACEVIEPEECGVQMCQNCVAHCADCGICICSKHRRMMGKSGERKPYCGECSAPQYRSEVA